MSAGASPGDRVDVAVSRPGGTDRRSQFCPDVALAQLAGDRAQGELELNTAPDRRTSITLAPIAAWSLAAGSFKDDDFDTSTVKRS